MQILFHRKTRQVVAILDKESVVDNDYALMEFDTVEPLYELKDGKLIVDLLNFEIRGGDETNQ